MCVLKTSQVKPILKEASDLKGISINCLFNLDVNWPGEETVK